MGSLKVTLCAGAALAAVFSPTAHAADGGGVSVAPASPAPGTDVTLRVADCTEKTAVAVSAAFVTDARLSLASTDGALVGSSRVKSTVTAGAYAVKVRCGDAERSGTLTVTDRARPRPTRRTGPAPTPLPSPPSTRAAAARPAWPPPADGTTTPARRAPARPTR